MNRFLLFVFIMSFVGMGGLYAQSPVEDLNKKELMALFFQLDSSLHAERLLLKEEEDGLSRLQDSVAEKRLLLKLISERRKPLSDSLTEISSRIQISKNEKTVVSALLKKENDWAGKSASIATNVRFAVTSDKVDSVSYSDPSGTTYYHIRVGLVVEGISHNVDSYVCIMRSAGECGQNDSQGFDPDLLEYPEQIREDLILDAVILGREISRQNTVYTRMAAMYCLDEILIVEFELKYRDISLDKPIRLLKSIPL